MSAKIGDLFPDKEKEEFAKGLLVKGAVLRLFSSDIDKVKYKRLIIIGFAEKNCIGKVYINSNPQSNHSQIKLASSGRAYLERDSFADCSRIYEDDYQDMVRALKADLSCHIGNVSTDDMQQIESSLRAARTIAINQKRRFGLVEPEQL